jgi:hypothetical protein
MLRKGTSMEGLFAIMLDQVRSDNISPTMPNGIAVVPGAKALRSNWLEDLARLAGAQQGALQAALARGEAPLSALRSAGGLTGWNLAADISPEAASV